MFKNILLPISSNFFPEKAIKRSRTMAEKLGSKIHFLYVVEKKMVSKMEETGKHVLSPVLIHELEEDIYQTQIEEISKTIFEKTRKLTRGIEKKCRFVARKGEFSKEIKKYIKDPSKTSEKIDCVLLEYKKGSYLQYRIFQTCNVPLWLERKRNIKTVFAATSCLSQNEMTPSYGKQLARSFGARLVLEHFNIDDKDKEIHSMKDDTGGNKRILKDWRGVSNMEKEILKSAERNGADLLVIGRTCKACNFFGFGSHLPKVTIAKKADMNVLIMYS